MTTKRLLHLLFAEEGGVLKPEIYRAWRLLPPLLTGEGGGEGVRVDIHVSTRSGSSP